MDLSESLGNRSETAQLDVVRPRHDSVAASSPANEGDSAAKMKRVLASLYAPIEPSMRAVESRLREEMQSPFEDVGPLLRHGVNLGGKRLRPAIHLLMAEALGGAKGSNVVIGVVLEMVHTATLIHDDVLDEATTRRHVATVNAKWNSHTSILLGDYLFSQSFRLAASLENTRTCAWVGEAARRVCEGELRQVLLRDEIDLDEATYYEIIRGKTAELCRVACSLAAAESGADDNVVDQLADFGDHLGVAFQIADDYLDLWGDDASVGKTLGTDLEQGKITLPVIRLLETSDDVQRANLIEVLRGDPQSRGRIVGQMLRQSDARQYTMNAAIAFKDKALEALQVLPDSDAKACLQSIAEFSIRRSF
ncbi:MAG: polyprenyl synthetase family protein [Planctomycetota bacterium]